MRNMRVTSDTASLHRKQVVGLPDNFDYDKTKIRVKDKLSGEPADLDITQTARTTTNEADTMKTLTTAAKKQKLRPDAIQDLRDGNGSNKTPTQRSPELAIAIELVRRFSDQLELNTELLSAIEKKLPALDKNSAQGKATLNALTALKKIVALNKTTLKELRTTAPGRLTRY